MSTKIRDYEKLAKDIINEVGGEENIINVSHCATRLRLVLKETPEGAKEKISSMTGVISVILANGQFQVVIGTHVIEVYSTVYEILDLSTKIGVEYVEKKSLMTKIMTAISAIFAPFIYILAAAGILQGLLIIINVFYPEFTNTGTYEVLSFMSWAPFTFLPIFVGITASKHFKTNTFIAVLCCCALVSPTWTDIAQRISDGETIKFLVFNLSSTTYTSTVLPPIFLVLTLSYLERFLNKKLSGIINSLFTPFICLVVMVPLVLLIIGPASEFVANGIANGYNVLYDKAPKIASIVVGAFWQVLVIFGVHHGITPISLANYALYGRDSIQAFQACAVIGQMAAAFGCYLKSKNKNFKGEALSAGITGIFGITEPAIYGVTLRTKKPFIYGCIGGALGSLVASLFNTNYYVYAGLTSLLTVVNAINPNGDYTSFIGEILGNLTSMVVPIVLILILGFDEPVENK